MSKKTIIIACATLFILGVVSFGVSRTLSANGGAGRHGSVEIAANGLHVQDWIYKGDVSFPRLLRTAASDNKGLIVLIEQRGCHFCAEMHATTFAKTEVTDFMREHFTIVQVDLRGSKRVMDFDGTRLTEQNLASRWGVRGTPTTLVFQKNASRLSSREEAESFRLPGYLKPFYYVSAFRFLISGAYGSQSFQYYIDERVAVLKAEGGDPETW